MKNIIIFSENLSQKMGGEAIKGFGIIDILTKRPFKVHIITHTRNKKEITESFSKNKNVMLYFIDDSMLHKSIYFIVRKINLDFVDSVLAPIISISTQIMANKIIENIKSNNEIYFIHQLNPISPLRPSAISISKERFLIGPLSGNPGLPGSENVVLNNVIIFISKTLHFIFRGRSKAARIYCSNIDTHKILSKLVPNFIDIRVILENAVDESWFGVKASDERKNIKIVFCGRLVWWKKVDLIIMAISKMQMPIQFIIIGDGPEARKLEKLASDLAVDVVFLGWRDKSFIQSVYAEATAFISPSIREAGGTSVQEAMAAGLPVIVTAWGGHLTRTPPNAGILIDPSSDETIIAGIQSGLRRIIDDPGFASCLGSAARDHARKNFRWEDIVDRMYEGLY